MRWIAKTHDGAPPIGWEITAVKCMLYTVQRRENTTGMLGFRELSLVTKMFLNLRFLISGEPIHWMRKSYPIRPVVQAMPSWGYEHVASSDRKISATLRASEVVQGLFPGIVGVPRQGDLAVSSAPFSVALPLQKARAFASNREMDGGGKTANVFSITSRDPFPGFSGKNWRRHMHMVGDLNPIQTRAYS